MGPKGSPRKSMSVPATITRIPASASASATSHTPSSRNWASSMATTCVAGRTFPASRTELDTGSASISRPSWDEIWNWPP